MKKPGGPGNGGTGYPPRVLPPIPSTIDIDYVIRFMKKQEVDYNYIMMLIQTYVPEKDKSNE